MKGKVIEPEEEEIEQEEKPKTKRKGLFNRKKKEEEEETETEEEEETKKEIVYLTQGEASILQHLQFLSQQIENLRILVEKNI